MADNVAQKLDRLYTGLIHIHYGLRHFYQKLDVGNVQQRQQTRLRLHQNIQELGRLINSLKPLISQTQVESQLNVVIKTAAPNQLSNLTNEINKRISEIANWTVMIKADEQDRQSMLARIHDLARMFHRLKDFLDVQEINNKAASLGEIVQFADYLDSIGAYALADTITESAFIIKQAYIPKARNEKVESEPPPIQSPHEGTLSTRYCPDHCGVQAIRVAERTYQCPIDGKIYNYETGYVNYQGQQVPGGSIAAQTPISSDSGGVPMRIYDSRQSVLNKIH